MAEQQNSLSEAAGVGSAVSDLFKLKRAAPFAKAVKGGVGGAAGAAIGMALGHKDEIKKSAVAITAALMLPVLFLTMLPGLTFGDLSENSGVLNSGTLINENLQKANQAIVEVLMECHDEVLAEIQQEASRVPEGDTVSITDPYAVSISVNSNLLIAQFCASRESYKEINIKELQKVIRENKDGLFSYDVSTETVTMEVEVDAGAEGEAGNGSSEGTSTAPQTKTVTFTRHNYVVKYAGDTGRPEGLSFSHYLNRLLLQGLIVKGDGLTGVDALYRLLGKLHIQPVTDHFPVRLFTCIQLYLEGKIKIRDFGRYLKKEKCDPMEETVLELAKATELTTAELLACVEQEAKAKNPKEVWDLLYEDTDATYESLADEAQLLHVQYPVLQAIGNLYLNKQISFQQF